MLKYFSLAVLLVSCVAPKGKLKFKRNSKETGIYESVGSNGKNFSKIDDSNETYYLSKLPSISVKEIETIEISDHCYSDEMCVDFYLTTQAKLKYQKLTKRNLDKQIFYVIDGVIINAPVVMGVIAQGAGQFTFEKKHLDSLFIVVN